METFWLLLAHPWAAAFCPAGLIKAGRKLEGRMEQWQFKSWISLAGEAELAPATVVARTRGESQSSVPISVTQIKQAHLSASPANTNEVIAMTSSLWWESPGNKGELEFLSPARSCSCNLFQSPYILFCKHYLILTQIFKSLPWNVK